MCMSRDTVLLHKHPSRFFHACHPLPDMLRQTGTDTGRRCVARKRVRKASERAVQCIYRHELMPDAARRAEGNAAVEADTSYILRVMVIDVMRMEHVHTGIEYASAARHLQATSSLQVRTSREFSREVRGFVEHLSFLGRRYATRAGHVLLTVKGPFARVVFSFGAFALLVLFEKGGATSRCLLCHEVSRRMRQVRLSTDRGR